MKTRYDVVIAGGGPSGLYAAKRLSEKGLDVLVLERKREVGQGVICTGIIGREAFETFSLPVDSRLREMKEVRIVSPSGLSLTYRHPSPFAFIVDRKKFDRSISQEAEAGGAEIRTGWEVRDIRPERKGVKVLACRGRGVPKLFSARVAVVATGIDLKLNRKAGLGTPRGFLFGAQLEMPYSGDEIPTVYTGMEIAPGGFAWAVPSVGGNAKYGLLTEKSPKKYFSRFMARHFPSQLGAARWRRIRYKAIVQGLASKTSGPAVISLGEAAGQVKTTTGGGISYGVHCAEIASRVIAAHLKSGLSSGEGLADYERQWRKVLQREIQVGLFARKIWARLTDVHIEKLFEAAQDDGLIPLIQDKGNFDWHSDLILALLRKTSLFKIMTGVGRTFLPGLMHPS